MKNIITSAVTTIALVLVIAFVGISTRPSQAPLGGSIETVKTTFGAGFDSLATSTVTGISSTGGLKVGSAGTTIGTIITGTCNLFSSGDTIAATSSVIASCLATGVRAGDTVFMSMPTSTAGNSNNFALGGSAPSSTNDYIAVKVTNLSGGASQTTKAGTSTKYLIIRP